MDARARVQSALERWWTVLLSVWEAIHVERHGKYSVERLQQFIEYQRSTTPTRAWFVVLATPLPCLVVVTLLDSIPLLPPDAGISHSHGFWLRSFIMTWIINVAVMNQARHVIPRLPVTDGQLAWVPVSVSVFATAISFGLACAIGFPLPFAIPLSSPGIFTVFSIHIAVVWGRFLRANADVFMEFVDYFILVAKQASLIFVYAGINYIVKHLATPGQTAAACFLPAIKLAFKNWVGANVRQLEDFKPEMIVFNIEIFHALYVAFSMQSTTSRSTIVVLIAIDFILACRTLRRLTRFAESWTAYLEPAKAPFSSDDKSTNFTNAAWRRLSQSSRIAPISDLDPNAHAPTLLQVVQYIARTDATVLANPNIRVRSCSNVGIAKSAVGDKKHRPRSKSFAAILPSSMLAKTLSHSSRSTTPSIPLRPDMEHSKGSQSSEARGELRSSTTTRSERRVMNELDPAQRQAIVENVLQLLHMIEFAVLIEYTEVIIPVVYCLYVLVVSRLPTKVYYAQLRDLDSDSIQHNIGNILLYAFLELVSFVALSWFLRRRLTVSSVHQLAFVLERQFTMVQSKLVLWVMVTVQLSLEHFGADYSFQFKWLRTAAAATAATSP